MECLNQLHKLLLATAQCPNTPCSSNLNNQVRIPEWGAVCTAQPLVHKLSLRTEAMLLRLPHPVCLQLLLSNNNGLNIKQKMVPLTGIILQLECRSGTDQPTCEA